MKRGQGTRKGYTYYTRIALIMCIVAYSEGIPCEYPGNLFTRPSVRSHRHYATAIINCAHAQFC